MARDNECDNFQTPSSSTKISQLTIPRLSVIIFPVNPVRPPTFPWPAAAIGTLIFTGLLFLLFAPCTNPDTLVANNDDPAGIIHDYLRNGWRGWWFNWFSQRWLGMPEPWIGPLWKALALFLGTNLFAQWAPALVLLFSWCASWICGWRITRHAGATALFAIATTLGSTLFTNVAWGLGWRPLFHAWVLLGLAIAWPRPPDANQSPPPSHSAARWGCAGGCWGLALAEGFDVAALTFLMLTPLLLSLVLLDTPSGWRAALGRIAAVAAIGLCVMVHPIVSSYQTQVSEIHRPPAHAQETLSHRNWATQWSLPPGELFRLLIPKLTGVRSDSPLPDIYWGGIGRDPSGTGLSRHSGSSDYPGLLTILAASWAILRAGWEHLAARRARRQTASPSPSCLFSETERIILLLLAAITVFALLLALGRYAPFYAIVENWPGVSSIRNPIKFLHPATLSLQLMAAMAAGAWARATPPPAPALHWVACASALRRIGRHCSWTRLWCRFSLGWILFSTATLGAILILRPQIVAGLIREFGDLSPILYANTITDTWIYWGFALFCAALLLARESGGLAGKRNTLFWIFATAFMTGDLLRAGSPWLMFDKEPLLHHPPDPVLSLLAKGTPPERVGFIQSNHPILRYWHQRAFPYLGIPCLDPIQLPRTPRDYADLQDAAGNDRSKLWRMTATRHLIGPANAPKSWGLREILRFDLSEDPSTSGHAKLSQEGGYALYALDDAAPRVELIPTWEVATHTLIAAHIASPKFDPTRHVWVEENPPHSTPPEPHPNPVNQTRVRLWTGLRIEIETESNCHGLLVLRERFHPFWTSEVDGRPAPLLRCNLVFRAIALSPGAHTVTLYWNPPRTSAVITVVGLFAAIASGLFLHLRRH
jgi:hypothetical protein